MTPGGYPAFYPSRLPRRLDLPQNIVKMLDEATGAVHRLSGIGLQIQDPHQLNESHLRIEAVMSSRIEGTTTDIPQLLRLQAGLPPNRVDDAREVASCVAAMEHGLNRVRRGSPLSIRLLCEMHELLLSGVGRPDLRPGELRTTPNWIGGTTPADAVFVPPPPEEMEDALANWEFFLREQDMPLLIQLALAHYQFEVIHPFIDGNGRIGRMVVPLSLVRRGVLTYPLLYLSASFEQHTKESTTAFSCTRVRRVICCRGFDSSCKKCGIKPAMPSGARSGV